MLITYFENVLKTRSKTFRKKPLASFLGDISNLNESNETNVITTARSSRTYYGNYVVICV